MDVTANYGWRKPADREDFLEILLQGVLDEIDADLKAYANTPHAARVYNSANISVSHATSTLLTFNSERRDDGPVHSTSSNTSRLVAPAAGWYVITFVATYAYHAAGFRAFNLKLNGATFIDGCEIPAVSTDSEGTLLTITTLYYLSAGDYVEVYAYQTSGAALNVFSIGNYSPEFAMILLARTS